LQKNNNKPRTIRTTAAKLAKIFIGISVIISKQNPQPIAITHGFLGFRRFIFIAPVFAIYGLLYSIYHI